MNLSKRTLLSAAGLALAALLPTSQVQAQATNPPAALQATQHRVTADQFERYYDLFNRYDPAYGELLADDVVYPHPSGKTLHGRKEIMDHYTAQAERLHDKRIPTAIIIDNEGGQAAVEMRNEFSVDEGKTYTFGNGTVIKPGEVWEGSTVMIYGLKDGKISSIRGSLTSPGRLKRIK